MPLSPEQVHRRLHEAARSFRWSRATRWLAAGAVVSPGCLIVFLLGDARFHVGAAARWAGFLGVISPLATGAAGALPAWLRPVPELAIARRIEAACPGAGNALVNAVQFDHENTATEIARTRDVMGKTVEGMLTDANVFPDMIISNELLFLRADRLQGVAGLRQASQTALREDRVADDYRSRANGQ